MLKILTVMKSGGIYTFDHVSKIKKQCQRHITIPYEFYCLSDKFDDQFNIISLTDNFSGWFSKLELFKIMGPCFYLDLDTIITNNIDSILEKCLKSSADLVTLRDKISGQIGSGLMFWNSDLEIIYKTFIENKHIFESKYGTRKQYSRGSTIFGDQEILNQIVSQTNLTNSFFDDQNGEHIVSFKLDLQHGKLFNQDIHKIVFFHGNPRPWNQNLIIY